MRLPLLIHCFPTRRSSVFLLGIPGAAIIDAAQGRAAGLGSLPGELTDHLSSTYGYTKAAIPASTYPDIQTSAATTVVTSTSLYASSDVPNDVVSKVTEAICKNAARLPDVHKSMMGFMCNAEAMGDRKSTRLNSSH